MKHFHIKQIRLCLQLCLCWRFLLHGHLRQSYLLVFRSSSCIFAAPGHTRRWFVRSLRNPTQKGTVTGAGTRHHFGSKRELHVRNMQRWLCPEGNWKPSCSRRWHLKPRGRKDRPSAAFKSSSETCCSRVQKNRESTLGNWREKYLEKKLVCFAEPTSPRCSLWDKVQGASNVYLTRNWKICTQ